MATAYSGPTPKHLWIVGILSLLWNCFGAYDYVMTMTRNAAWLEMAGFGPEEMAWLDAFPAWAVAAYAIGIWASVAGSILLLLRSRHAELAFAASLVGALVSLGYQFTTERPAALETPVQTFLPLVILIAIVAQWYYARRQAAAGVLR